MILSIPEAPMSKSVVTFNRVDTPKFPLTARFGIVTAPAITTLELAGIVISALLTLAFAVYPEALFLALVMCYSF